MRSGTTKPNTFFLLGFTGALCGLVGGALALAIGWWPRTAHAGSSSIGESRPDIVMILLDDTTSRQIKYLNGAGTGERLRQAFTRLGIGYRYFPNYHVSTPVCVPSRSSLLRGQYAHRHGVKWNNESSSGAADGGCSGFTSRGLDQSTIATWLQDGGYQTMLVGKYLNGYDQVSPQGFVPPGWSEWHALFSFGEGGYWNFSLSENETIVPYPRQTDDDYSTDVLGRRAIQLVSAVPPTQPYFLVLSLATSHSPGTPAPDHTGLREGLIVPRPPENPAYLEEDVSDKNTWIQSMPYPPTQEQIDAQDRYYRNAANSLAAVTRAWIGLLDALEAAGRLERTIFITTSDNGWLSFVHRFVGKRCFYDEAARTFLVVSSSNPQYIPNTGKHRGLVANIDLAPTMAELAGVTIPPSHEVDGVSFASLIQDNTLPPVRTDLLIENFGPEPFRDTDAPQDFPAYDAIVTGPGHPLPRWKYARFRDGQRELYNLIVDPFELESSVNDPGNASVVSALDARLNELLND